MKIPPLLSEASRISIAACASAALIAGVLLAPAGSGTSIPEQTPAAGESRSIAATVAGTTVTQTEAGPVPEVQLATATAGSAATSTRSAGGLPHLGFSLNGEALSGPISATHYKNLAAMSSGTEWARLGATGDGKWKESLDKYLIPIRQAGMKVLLRASFRGAVYDRRVPLDATEQARYGDFVRELAEYVKIRHGLTPNDVVFEHPNESNGLVSGAEYAGAARDAYPKLKSVDPGYKIIGASENVYASNWQTWLQDVYKAGYAQGSDGVSFHNYDAQGSRGKYTFLENLMKQHGHWPAMVWLSEFGTTTTPGATGDGSAGAGLGGQSEAGQAVRITGVLKFLRDEYPWITHAFVYADEDIPPRKSTDPFEANFGIYANDANGTITREKPAVQAIRDLYASAGGSLAAQSITPAQTPVHGAQHIFATSPEPASTSYFRYKWSSAIFARVKGGSESKTRHLTYDDWKNAGNPTPALEWSEGIEYYQWAGSSQVFASVALLGGAKYALTYPQWAESGFRPFTKRTNQGYVKLSWDHNIAYLHDYAGGKGSPITGERWSAEGHPEPVVSTRISGDQLYQYYGSATIWYAGPTVNRPITYDEWRLMGFPWPTMR